jgi:DNA-binding IscR family transcriptional regulator
LLKSIRGVDGGYYLLRPADEISLLSIMEATDGPLTPIVPPLDGIAEASRKRLNTLLKEITAEASRRLAAVRLRNYPKMFRLFLPRGIDLYAARA